MNSLTFKGLETPDIVRILGANFKEYRLNKRLTQGEVAALTGLTIATISKFESGMAANISFSTFLQLLIAIDAIDDMTGVLPPLAVDQMDLMGNPRRVRRIRHKRQD